MPKIKYIDISISPAKLAIINQANAIIAEYAEQGFDLTLRQLYYQFVARDLIPNKQTEYKRLGDIVGDGRLAGLIDWEAIVDRTRNLRDLAHWKKPDEIVDAAASQYRVDKWATQRYRPEVWIEKDALVGVISGVCEELDVPYFSCRGYTSLSEVWSAGQRLRQHARRNGRGSQIPIILHFGDHDPSGMDMTRDIRERLALFSGLRLEVRRLALNFDQVEEYNPPPNPTKLTDSRATAYMAEYGGECWELDALEPTVLAGLIRGELETLRDDDAWQEAIALEETGRASLQGIADRFEEVRDYLEGNEGN